MKLLIVTCLKEDRKAAANILDRAGVQVFSASETTGFRNQPEENLLDNWFAHEHARYNSAFIFSFTTSAHADRALKLIREHNDINESPFPLRAFVVPVEQASYAP
jgi:hypothetical protein